MKKRQNKKTFHYRFIKSQTHFGMQSREARVSLGPQWAEIGCSSFKFKHYLRAYTITREKNLLILYGKSWGDELPTKSLIEWKDELSSIGIVFYPYLAVRLKTVTEKPASRMWPHMASPITPVPIHLRHSHHIQNYSQVPMWVSKTQILECPHKL